jgi:hypothetical protein
MAIQVKKWIGSNGDVLLPLSVEDYNEGNLYSVKTGALYQAQTVEIVAIETGNPMGLLLALTYA